ncbi:hydrolase [Bacillus sp. REN3]|uniref:hydrolase n=1 Tax=Bacillus sp. REN3 TaxID=2802440 RepID=UPI001AEE749C|nr:hydrolase [Bacillus sp. REN3]
MESRNFILDTEWNMIHYPEKPNGFGILILGDERNFVDKSSSFWTQNEGKVHLLDFLKAEGYTIFYSNLYGRHWGSDKAVDMSKRLCSHIVRNEILNGTFHVMAEGMGALAALKLLSQEDVSIRSVVLINPVLSLTRHLELEKENKFFYKKLLGELERAYGVERNSLLAIVKKEEGKLTFHPEVPVKIIHVLSGNRAYKQSKTINELSAVWEQEKLPVQVTYVLPEKKQQIGVQAVRFYKDHEQVL